MVNQTVKPLELISIKLPVWWTFGALILGLGGGSLIGALLGTGEGAAAPQGAGHGVWLAIWPYIELIGTLWLRALQMTIIPLVAALLILGISQMALAAKAGAVAGRMLVLIFAVLLISGMLSAVLMPLLLEAFPIPNSAAAMLHVDGAAGGMDGGGAGVEAGAEAGAEVGAGATQLPQITDFLGSLIAPNLIAAAGTTAMLPLTIFFALFAVAVARLPKDQNTTMIGFFHALANTMLTIIGWVLWLAPIGVFALAMGVGIRSGSGAFVTLAHYVLAVSAMGACVLIGAYVLAIFGGRQGPIRFAKAALPAQAVAISTQSSLASLPAMLASARRMGVSERVADFVLPLLVAIFRATSPAMNMAVVIYIATIAGLELNAVQMIAGILVAFIISVGSVSLPGSISFVVSVGPIAAAMGVPVEPLALLVAVEMLPDIMRTLANVTMNLGVTSAVDRSVNS